MSDQNPRPWRVDPSGDDPACRSWTVVDASGKIVLGNWFGGDRKVALDLIAAAVNAVNAQSPWISVEDRLPEPGVYVLTWNPRWSRKKQIVLRYGEPIEAQWDMLDKGEWLNPSLWMPLPEPPST